MGRRCEVRGVGFYESPIFGHELCTESDRLSGIECDHAGEREGDTQLEEAFGPPSPTRPAVKNGPAPFSGVNEDVVDLGERVTAMDYEGFAQFGRETDVIPKRSYLNIPRRKLAIEVEPCLADGHRGCCELAQLIHLESPPLRVMGVEPACGEDPPRKVSRQGERRPRASSIDTWHNDPGDVFGASEELGRIASVELEMTMCVHPIHDPSRR